MTFGPVGIRCPDHAGVSSTPVPMKQVARQARRSFTYGPFITFTLIGLNVGVFILELLLGGEINGTRNWIYEHGVLLERGQVLPNGDVFPRVLDPSFPVIGVAEGEWWRLITAAFLHYGPLHLGMNMLVLWFIGPALESYLGHWRYLLLYVVSGLAGSAGALLLSPDSATVGASGAIWGLMGAALVLELRRIYVFGGSAMGLVVLNLVLTFLVPGVSIGGHIGGLIGGAAAIMVFIALRRTPALATLAVAGVGALSVAVALAAV
jgi:membrane associated rhomboid family serine protease